MKKSKNSKEQPMDRLSMLPDSIIFEIFGLLPVRDFVRATVLSKRWKNLWTTAPYLNFDTRDAPKFINRALILWKGFKILKFKIVCRFPHNGSMNSDIDSWVHLAKENGVEELHLEDMARQSDESRVPHVLYSCSSLKVLSLIGCKLQIDENVNVQWNQLRSLTIEECSHDEHLINKVVCGSPQLEVLILNLWDNKENLSIRSNSLKKLSINNDQPSEMKELRIWSPNLETLDFSEEPYGKYLLMNVSSLTHVTVHFFYESFGDLGEILWQIIPAIQHVEKLTISDRCIEAFGTMKKELQLSNFKFLEINHNTDCVEYEEILDFLRICPKLETLVLRYCFQFTINDTGFLQVERNLPESFLLQLRTVEIICSDDEDLIFPFIEILLKHASKLQKMVIRVDGI